VIAVQADAAEAALLKEPARARAPMGAIRDSARDALDDMRQLLHLLRAQDHGSATDDLTPARGLEDLPQLVATMRDAGLRLHAELESVGPLSTGTELAVFRIVQEALTNVRRHAGDVPTRLRIARLAHEVSVAIDNDPMPTRRPEQRDVPSDNLSTGYGLLGLRERVQAAGGSLHAGPTESGGFCVTARLPITPRQAP
jgi:signal transduction histidine kinase